MRFLKRCKNHMCFLANKPPLHTTFCITSKQYYQQDYHTLTDLLHKQNFKYADIA